MTAAEFIGVTVLIAAVIAALLATPFASTIRDWGEYAVCTLFGGECDDPDEHDSQPLFACEQQREQRGGNANVGFVVDIDRNIDYTITTFSDGTVQLTYADGTAVGAGVGVGIQADLYWGEGQLTVGGQASAGGALRFIEGEIYEWSDPDAYQYARDWRFRHALSDGASDVLLPGPVSNAGGAALRGIVDGTDWVLRKIPGVDGLQIVEPDRVLIHAEGGIELHADVTGGGISPGFSNGLPGLQNPTAAIEASMGSAVGTTVDTRTGERIVYLTTSSGIEVDVAADVLGVTASWADQSIVAVHLDANGQFAEAAITNYRLDEAGRDITSAASLRDAFPDRRFGDATISGRPLGQPSLYEVQTRIDLTTDEGMAALDNVLVGGALQAIGGLGGSYGGEAVLRPAHQAGTTTIVEYGTSDRRYGADVGGGKIIEVTGGASLSASDREALAAYFFDEVTGGYQAWTRCVD